MFSQRIFTPFIVLIALCGTVGCAFERDVAAGSSDAVVGRPYFDVWQNEGGQHYFNFSAANHEVMLASEGYTTRGAALNGVLSVVDNGVIARRYELREASNGEHYFVLKARNGRIIGVSETYATRSGANNAVDSVMANVDRYQGWLADRAGARFDVFRGADGRFYFNLHAANGEVVLTSQGYSAEAAAMNAVFSVAANGTQASRYDIRETSNGEGYYFNLRASNGRVIGSSEVYATRYNAERGRDAVINLLPTVELL